jgi:hypothetical protein
VLRLVRVTVAHNVAGGTGGGISNAGTVSRVKVTFRDNQPNACTGC